MWYELKKHRLAYLILLLSLVGFLLVFLGLWPNRIALRGLSCVLGVFYVAWGVKIHHRAETLTQQVVLEYMGVAAIAVVGLLIVTL